MTSAFDFCPMFRSLIYRKYFTSITQQFKPSLIRDGGEKKKKNLTFLYLPADDRTPLQFVSVLSF